MSVGKKITLRSSDGESIEEEEAVAMQSQRMKRMLDDDCGGTVIDLGMVTGKILLRVFDYCQYYVSATASAASSDVNKLDEDFKAFVTQFLQVDCVTLFDILKAVSYLDINTLEDLTVRTVAEIMKGKTANHIRVMFNFEDDLTAEEKEEIRELNKWIY